MRTDGRTIRRALGRLQRLFAILRTRLRNKYEEIVYQSKAVFGSQQIHI